MRDHSWAVHSIILLGSTSDEITIEKYTVGSLYSSFLLALRVCHPEAPSLSHTLCLLNALPFSEILIWLPNLAILGEILPLEVIFFSLEL